MPEKRRVTRKKQAAPSQPNARRAESTRRSVANEQEKQWRTIASDAGAEGNSANEKDGSVHKRSFIKVFILLFVLMLAAAAVVILVQQGVFSGSHDEDAKRIQGEWQTSNATMVVVITSNQLKLPGGTAYDYTIDVSNGTVEFGVGEVQGSATYEFGIDEEGQTTLTLVELLDGAETTTVLTKLSSDTAAVPRILSSANADAGANTNTNVNTATNMPAN